MTTRRKFSMIALAVVGALAVYQLGSGKNEPTELPAPLPLTSDPVGLLMEVPNLAFFEGSSNRSVTLSDFKGRPILLNIWATWCSPCRKEMPSLDRLQAKFDPKDFLVLPLSIDRADASTLEAFYLDTGIQILDSYVDRDGRALRELGIVGIPATLLIDANGLEIGRKLGPAKWDDPSFIELIRGLSRDRRTRTTAIGNRRDSGG